MHYVCPSRTSVEISPPQRWQLLWNHSVTIGKALLHVCVLWAALPCLATAATTVLLKPDQVWTDGAPVHRN